MEAMNCIQLFNRDAIPYLGRGPAHYDRDGITNLFGELASELAECLKLINEFIYDIPEPLVGKFQRNGSVSIYSSHMSYLTS